MSLACRKRGYSDWVNAWPWGIRGQTTQRIQEKNHYRKKKNNGIGPLLKTKKEANGN